MVLDRIVVGLASGPRAQAVARWAQAQFGRCCTVERVPLSDAGEPRADSSWRAWWHAVAGAAHDVEDAQADVLAAAAFERAADLVVAGPATDYAVERLVRLSPVPVLIVPEGAELGPLWRVLAAVDERPATEAVLAWALALHRALGAQVVPCHVVEPPSFQELRHAGWQLLAGHDAALQPESLRGPELRRRLRAAGLGHAEPELRIRTGSPADEIAAQARESRAGLIVVGTLRPELGTDVQAGEVRRPLLHRAHVPILVASRAHPAPVLKAPTGRGRRAAAAAWEGV